MKIIIAPDSFNGSIRAADAAIAIQRGCRFCKWVKSGYNIKCGAVCKHLLPRVI